MSELNQTEFDSSEDELPEEVAFDESRSVALKSVKDALESDKREKNLLKEKRRKRQQFFLEQKRRKCLPENVLEEFDALPEKRTKALDDNNKDEDEAESDNKSKTISKSLQDNCSVVRLKDNSSVRSLQLRAEDFIQSRLYGPGTRRTTNAELLNLNNKRGTNKGAAVQFQSKKLGADVKAKAEKSNKRFRHKQKLVLS